MEVMVLEEVELRQEKMYFSAFVVRRINPRSSIEDKERNANNHILLKNSALSVLD